MLNCVDDSSIDSLQIGDLKTFQVFHESICLRWTLCEQYQDIWKRTLDRILDTTGVEQCKDAQRSSRLKVNLAHLRMSFMQSARGSQQFGITFHTKLSMRWVNLLQC